MDVKGHAAIVTGGASGLGAATARMLAAKGTKVGVMDQNADLAKTVAEEIGGLALPCDVTSETAVQGALDEAKAAHGVSRVLVNCAGIGAAARVVGRNGPFPLDLFTKVINVNLIGTFNVIRLWAVDATQADPLEDDERGVVIMTASVAAFDGQIGQAAYSASKGGIVGMTLPIARDFTSKGIRVNTIAPGLLLTPLMDGLSPEAQKSLSESIPFPARLGKPEEYASLALHLCENSYINAETIRLDAALRMQAR